MSTNGTEGQIADPALRERVANLSEDVRLFRGELRNLHDTMATRTDFLNLQSAIAALSDRQQPKYSLLVAVMGLGVTILIAIGTLAYWPINAATGDLKLGLLALADRAVLQRQYEADVTLARVDRQSIRTDLQNLGSNSIQQQRYNADKAARDGEVTILRERFDKMLTRSEFDSQHGDLKLFINKMMDLRDRQLVEIIGRVSRAEAMAVDAAKTGARQEDLDKRFTAISERLAQHMRDEAATMRAPR